MARHAPPVQIYCAVPTVSGAESATASVSVIPSVHPQAHNIWGGFVISDRTRLYTSSEPEYLWARFAQFIAVQPLGWSNASGRASELPNYETLISDNPYVTIAIHDNPWTNTVSYRSKANLTQYFRYEYMAENRHSALLFIDHDDGDEIAGNLDTQSTSPSKQAGVTMNIADSGVQEWMAKVAHDMITGGDLTGYGIGGPDLSSNVIYFNDTAPVTGMKPANKLMNTQAKGSINTIVSADSLQPVIVRLSNQPNLPTTGTLSQDTSFGLCDNVESVFFQPAATASAGFMGLHILGYKNVASGRSEIYLKDLPNQANTTQTYTPAAGHSFNICQRSNTTINGDWDADGSTDSAFDNGHTLWSDGYNSFWDNLEAKVSATSGIKTGRGWNSVSGSYIIKRTEGFKANHNQIETADILNTENGTDDIMPARSVASGHSYDTSNPYPRMSRLMEKLHFGAQMIRPDPGGRIGQLGRGNHFEVEPWGNNYNDVNALDANYIRFFKAVSLCTPKVTGLVTTLASLGSNPVAIEEFFIDFDTNWTTPYPLGVYDPSGGIVGPSGFPVGSWTWSTSSPGDLTDNGRRIYIRRFGGWLGAFNMADRPSDYPSSYSPSHLSGYTPRDPEDIITPSDFSQLVTDGVVSSGYTLTHFDPSTYTNPVLSSLLGFSYGPQQSSPWDSGSPYTLATLPNMARDPTRNNGKTVNKNQNYSLGPWEAVFWKIS